MKTRTYKFTLISAAMLLTGLNNACLAGDPDAGREKSAVCAACHGADGNSTIPANPILAGQHRDYLEQVLHEYRSGARPNPVMAGMAAPLSDEDIADIAAWFSSQKALGILNRDPM